MSHKKAKKERKYCLLLVFKVITMQNVHVEKTAFEDGNFSDRDCMMTI